MALPKCTMENSQVLRVCGRNITIPPNTFVQGSLLGVQTHPRHWDEPLVWRPLRWVIQSQPAAADLATRLDRETVFTPAQSTYFPWSDGPQNCPGAKFSQVEFVAVLACLLRGHRVGAIGEPHESEERLKERIMATVNDCDMQMLLRMRDADRIRLTCRQME